jgi:hypothetical protein
MHEFKHGELKSGPGGKAGKVQSRRQAVAIALNEARASKYESERENKRHLARTERKEARGRTYQQTGRQIACGCAQTTRKQPAMGGKNATKNTRHRRTAGRKITRGRE